MAHLTPVTLTFDPKSIGFLCYPGRMCGPSLMKLGKDVLELEKVTDGPTCAKQYALSSLKGGIISPGENIYN